jgi:uncharacterized protein (TIGR02246 family)
VNHFCHRSHAFFGLVVLPAVVAGCNSRAIEQGRVEVPVRATASADPSQPMLRTIPDVITKPKPFRLPDAIGPTMSLEPATMAPRGGIALAAAERAAPAPATLDFPPGRPAVEEVAAMLGEYLRAFNRHDPAALAAHWSEAGENVDLDTGETTRGREAVAEVFATLFQEDAGATIDIDVESIRPIRDDVALVDGVSRIGFSDGASPAAPSGSRFSAVVVKEQGRWMLASVREASLAAPAPLAEPARNPLDALAWLVGSWEDVGEGVTAGTQCFWSAGRAFLVRSHVVTFDAGAAVRTVAGDDSIPGLLPPGAPGQREITEIIGWDADRRSLRSWLFSSDGRFAEATWTPEGKGWRVRLEGQGADAAATGSVFIERAGADEVSIRCDDDGLADVMPPACDFVRTARLGAAE